VASRTGEAPRRESVVESGGDHAVILAIALEDLVASSLKIVFCGTGAFGLPALRALSASSHRVTLVVTQPDRPAGRHRELKPSPVKEFALAAGMPVYQPERLNHPDAVERLRAEAPDVMVVVSYGQILKQPILDLPRPACVNLHGSLLPRHRGASPVQAAILAGDSFSGTTSMIMDAGLDTGPALIERAVEIGPRETAPELHDRLAEVGGDLLLPTLEGLADGTLVPRPQDPAGATICRVIEKEAGRIDWRRSATEIERAVRAYVPWPCASCVLQAHDGTRLGIQIHEARVIDDASSAPPVPSARPTVSTSRAARAGCACSRSNPEGKTLMTADAWLRGRTLGSDDRMAVEEVS
jgi:methionyl-tRNA formyltransferase